MAFTMRDQTFITIHNITSDANILFASGSVRDILGYETHEVEQRSCFNYFHPAEVPFARSIHSRGVLLDKAAVLHYARIRHRDGHWISCECCFTVVHNVLVACTSVYSRSERSEKRAMDAQQIRRIFSSSPRDPRYHMLEHLSPKFRMPPSVEREPRAALILNRFAATLPIMFATNAVAAVLGLEPRDVHLRSFYELMEEPCLRDAIRCLENAKANESIAYLRFWFRDPRAAAVQARQQAQNRAVMPGGAAGGGEEDQMMEDVGEDIGYAAAQGENSEAVGSMSHGSLGDDEGGGARPRDSSALAAGSGLAGDAVPAHSAQGAAQRRPPRQPSPPAAEAPAPAAGPKRVELEAVVSCSSDGLVVVLRRARPAMPAPQLSLHHAGGGLENGFFAAPWAQRPMVPPDLLHNYPGPFQAQRGMAPCGGGREDVTVQVAAGADSTAANSTTNSSHNPRPVVFNELYQSIQDMAVFAWALTGINGNLAGFGRGQPLAGAQPPDGLPIWDPETGPTGYEGPDNQAYMRWGPPYSEEPTLITELTTTTTATAMKGGSNPSRRMSGNDGGAPVLRGGSRQQQKQQQQQLLGEMPSYHYQRPNQYALWQEQEQHQQQRFQGHGPAGQQPSLQPERMAGSLMGQTSGAPFSTQQPRELAQGAFGITRRASPPRRVDHTFAKEEMGAAPRLQGSEAPRDIRNIWL